MNPPLTPAHQRRIVADAHRNGITDLRITLLIEHRHTLLLVPHPIQPPHTPLEWTLPATTVLPGHTLQDALQDLYDTRLHTQPQHTAFLGAYPSQGDERLQIAFALTLTDPAALAAELPRHRWLDPEQPLHDDIDQDVHPILEHHHGMIHHHYTHQTTR
jgi:hypothetical protein